MFLCEGSVSPGMGHGEASAEDPAPHATQVDFGGGGDGGPWLCDYIDTDIYGRFKIARTCSNFTCVGIAVRSTCFVCKGITDYRFARRRQFDRVRVATVLAERSYYYNVGCMKYMGRYAARAFRLVVLRRSSHDRHRKQR